MTIKEHVKSINFNQYSNKHLIIAIDRYSREFNTCAELCISHNWDLEYTFECHQTEIACRLELIKRKYCDT